MARVARKRSLVGIAVLAAALTVATISAPATGAPLAAPAKATVAQVVPKPVSITAGNGKFTLTRPARIVSDDAAVGNALAGYLRPATGYRLDVVTGAAQQGDIALRIGDPGTPGDEGYQLDVTTGNAIVTAKTAHGLYNAVQTIRQLLPGWIDSPTGQVGPGSIPAVHIVDSFDSVSGKCSAHGRPVSSGRPTVAPVSSGRLA
jgi:hexosaminidase